jgi:hypothetical protein
MMLPSHLLAALLLGLVISHWRRFTPKDWALALGFSVAIDLDHLLQLPVYIATHGAASLARPMEIVHWGEAWQGFMHTPWALILVAAGTVAWRSWVPLLFWGLHMFQDFVIATRFVVFGSPQEWVVVAALAALVAALFWYDHRRHGAREDRLHHHVARRLGLRSAAVAAVVTPVDED